MRARPPVTRVEGPLLVVRTDLVATDGTDLPPLEVGLPVAHADLLDPTATSAVPVLASLAAARGEDLVVEGAVDEQMARGAAELVRVQSGWWRTGPLTVEVESTYASEPTGSGVGLFFSRGVDSWSNLLDLLDAPAPDRVTHLLTVHHGDEAHRPVEAEIVAGHQRVADELGLTLVVLSTSARTLLDPYQPWLAVAASALMSAGLVAAGRLRRLVLSGSTTARGHYQLSDDTAVLDAMATGATEIVLGTPDRTRPDRVARLVGHDLARGTLQVCWEGMTAGNCGRCEKCQVTMATLLLAGDADPTRGFDGAPDPARVRDLAPADYLEETVLRLVADLPPEHEALRRAWADAWARTRGLPSPPRWGDDGGPGLAGPDVAQRVAAARRTTTGSPDVAATAPLGWRPGAVPLRPALADHDAVRALTAAGPGRAEAWVVAEHHLRAGRQDGQQAALALLCHTALGPGPVYLPGILWGPDQPPVLDRAAVATLLRTARARLWWRPDGDIDPLRLVETVEQGCLPLQVMPTGPARTLAAELPPALAALILAEDDLADLDLSAAAVEERLAPAVELLLARSSEHDLLVDVTGG